MLDRQRELSNYRLHQAEESLIVAKTCLNARLYKDSINRSYYVVFYAIKAVLALGTVDFKRHKDVIAYFNKEYVAKETFPRPLGRKIGMLKQIREDSDYDDFYIASKEETEEQVETAEMVLKVVKSYLETEYLTSSKENGEWLSESKEQLESGKVSVRELDNQ